MSGTGSPSAILSRAADLIRDTAAKATPAQWTATDLSEHGHKGVWWIESDSSDDEGRSLSTVAETWLSSDAAWIALMSPAVAPMIEKWLRDTASYFDEFADYWITIPEQARAALALARAVLGEKEEQ